MSLTTIFDENAATLDRHFPPMEVTFEPEAWRPCEILEVTASYAYALNLPRVGECKPGYLGMKPIMDDATAHYGKPLPETSEELAIRLYQDGVTFLGNALPEEGHVVSFFAKPAHKNNPSQLLYPRRDDNGNWSVRIITEKFGCRNPHLPVQHDFSGNPVTCVRNADWGPFTRFLGYASLPYEGLFYHHRINPPAKLMVPFERPIPAAIELGWNIGNP